MTTEATAQPLLPVDTTRTIVLVLGKQTLALNFRHVTDRDWRQCLESITLLVEQKDGKRVTIEDESPALAALAHKALVSVNGQPVTSLPPRVAIAAGTVLRMATAYTPETDALSELAEIHVDAAWSADETLQMEMHKGLVHRLRQPSIEQLRRYKLGVARVATSGTAEDGTTEYPSRLAVALGLYDELIAEVDGYSVGGREIADVETIQKNMDGYHKAIVAYELFEGSSQPLFVGKPKEEDADGDATA